MYEDFAQIIEKNMAAICRQIAVEAIARHIPNYSSLSVDQLAKLVEPTVMMIVRYVRNGDPTEYRDHAQKLTETRMAQGYDTKYIITMGQILDRTLNQTLQAALPGAEHAEARTSFARRMAVIEQVGDSAVVMARLKRPKTGQ